MEHPTDIGDVSKMMITAHLIRAGYKVLLAASENCVSLAAASARTGSIRIRKNYRGQIEFFGIYCPELDKCYLVPVNDVPKREGSLRVEPPRNKQKALIRFAATYEVQRKN